MEQLHGIVVETDDIFLELAIRQIEKMIGEQEQILFSLFQVRDTDRELIDTMVQVLTEISFLDRLPQVLVRSRYQTYVDGDLLMLPIGFTLRSCRARNSWTCTSYVRFPISSKNIVPPWAATNAPVLFSDRPRKRTFHVAEELGSRQFLGDSAAIHGDKRSLATITLLVNPTAIYSLPVPLAPVTNTDISVGATKRTCS